MSDRVSVAIDGTAYRGWEEVSIRSALDEFSGSFELGLAEPWSAGGAPVPVRPFQRVEVRIGDDRVMSGIIDSAEPGYGSDTHDTAIAGRSLTGQLLDCSAVVPGGMIRDGGLADIARTLCQPFAISVVDRGGADAPFAQVAIESGETVSDVLDRLARQRGVWLTDDSLGRLVLTRRASDLQGALKGPLNARESGVRVLSGRASLNTEGQYSTYRVKGQTQGSDSWSAASAAAAVGSAQDLSVPLHRPLVILSETQGDDAALRERAVFEAALRRGRARRVTYEVPGWRRPDGRLWEKNRNVMVRDRALRIDGQMLVVAVSFVRSNQRGTLTELTCAEPEAFDLLAIPEAKKESAIW